MEPGSTLTIRGGSWGAFTYLALPGGIDIAPVMGSRSTHMRSKLGGFNGRMLASGDLLVPAAAAHDRDEAVIEAPWLAQDTSPVPAIPGPQDDYFSTETLELFFSAASTLTPAADRMAYKFSGPDLPHVQDFNIVTDGVALGAIQIAGDGQPIVQMADRASVGGYPKIAHIARVAIGRLAQLRPGETCHFTRLDAESARDALLALEDAVATTPDWLRPLKRVPTTESLLATNLIGGVIDGRF